jgi:hypothetical protein
MGYQIMIRMMLFKSAQLCSLNRGISSAKESIKKEWQEKVDTQRDEINKGHKEYPYTSAFPKYCRPQIYRLTNVYVFN